MFNPNGKIFFPPKSHTTILYSEPFAQPGQFSQQLVESNGTGSTHPTGFSSERDKATSIYGPGPLIDSTTYLLHGIEGGKNAK